MTDQLQAVVHMAIIMRQPQLFILPMRQFLIVYIKFTRMGSNGSKNDDFSQNPNFNMNQHRQAMQHLGSNYTVHNLNVQQSYAPRANVEQAEFKKITRSCSIYKPSFNIRVQNDAFILEFEYDSSGQNRVEIYAGVVDVQEDPNTQITLRVDSKLRFEEELPSGKKQKFSRTYPLSGYNAIEGSTLIIRVVSTIQSEVSEYSLKKVHTPNEHWKVLLQKLEMNGTVTQLQNIYKGDEANECLICLTTTSNTLIEPCNHLCLCSDCLKAVRETTNKCPICRNGISGFKVIVSNG